jgi:hypothetical protein
MAHERSGTLRCRRRRTRRRLRLRPTRHCFTRTELSCLGADTRRRASSRPRPPQSRKGIGGANTPAAKQTQSARDPVLDCRCGATTVIPAVLAQSRARALASGSADRRTARLSTAVRSVQMKRRLVVAILVLTACSDGGGPKPVTAPSTTVTSTVSVDAAICRDAAHAFVTLYGLNKPLPPVAFDGPPLLGTRIEAHLIASMNQCLSRADWLRAFADAGARRDRQFLDHFYDVGCLRARQARSVSYPVGARPPAVPSDCPSN